MSWAAELGEIKFDERGQGQPADIKPGQRGVVKGEPEAPFGNVGERVYTRFDFICGRDG